MPSASMIQRLCFIADLVEALVKTLLTDVLKSLALVALLLVVLMDSPHRISSSF